MQTHVFLFQKETKDKDGVTETDYPEGFCKEPFCTYEGHTGDVLDLSWSKVLYFYICTILMTSFSTKFQRLVYK